MAFSATNSSGLGPFRQMFIKWSTVDTSREFLYSVLSLDIQEKPLSQKEDETAIVKLISTSISTCENCAWLIYFVYLVPEDLLCQGFHGPGIQGM